MSLAKETIQALEANGNGNGKDPDAKTIIKALVDTKFSGSNEEQGKAVQLMRGLAFSDDPVSNRFMKMIDDFTSKLDPSEFESEDDDDEGDDD